MNLCSGLLALLGALCACTPAAKEQVVAIVGERELSGEELRQFVLNLLPGLHTARQGQEAREDYLQSLIDQEILLLEARSQGLESDPEVVEKLRLKTRDQVVSLFRQREIRPQVRVADEEIRRRFEEEHLERERWLTTLLVQSQEQAHQLRQRLEAGESFAELARGHSLDSLSARRGGELGYLSRPLAERLGIPAPVFDTLGTGAVSPPLRRGQAYQLVRFLGERRADLEAHQPRLRARLLKEKHQEIEDRQVELLAYELGWALGSVGLERLRSQARTLAQKGLQLSARDRQQPLFTYEGGEISIDEYLKTLIAHRVKSPRALEDSAFIAAIGRRLILPTAMLAHAAARAGIPQEPEVRQWAENLKKELLLTRLRQLEVSDKVQVSDQQVQEYIAGHPHRFQTPETICYDELIVPHREEAIQLARQLKGDADLREIARQRGFKVRPRQADGLVCLMAPSKAAYPVLWQALQSAPLDQLEGPVETRDGHILFKVVRRQAPKPEPYEKARKRAHAALVQSAERLLFDQWLAGLRQKYQDQVRIFPDRLKDALPEALLAGLIREPQKDVENQPANN